VPVDARIERGRTVRHALRELAAHERFDRIVVAAGADSSGEGFTPEAVAWLLTNVPGEVIVLRPASAAPQTALQPQDEAQATLQPGEAALPQPQDA
jgi:glycine/D-amino acid oxidase-like deaminating enzyme